MLSVSFGDRTDYPTAMKSPLLVLTCLSLMVGNACRGDDARTEGWVSLFNGKDLSGWTVKIAGHPAGENFANTFRVEDGILKAEYDGYERFDMQFGHLFTNVAYSRYVLRLEYKLPGSGMADAPHWTNRNSGVMLHAQSPLSMRVEQGFPVSIEGQFLAEGATAGTQTANLVTPGTHIHINGTLTEAHIIDSRSRLFPGDEWVRFEAEVRGHDSIVFRINGQEVHRGERPVLDPSDQDARHLLAAGASAEVGFGHIALQAEGSPVWFRKIEIRPLP